MQKIFLTITFFALWGLLFSCKEDEIVPTKSCSIDFVDTSSVHPKATLFQSVIDEYTQKGLPGISLLVRDASGLWVGASGMADIEKGIPMEPCHVSKVASVTKLFIGVLVMQEVEKGVLGLDDPIAQWLTDEDIKDVENADQVTLRQLLNHTSGIFDVITDNNFYLAVLNDPGKFWTPKELLKFVRNRPAVFPPGTDVEYSNTNLLYASMVLEAATGQSHAKLLRDNILTPLGMNNSYYHWHESLPDFVAQGYFDLYNDGTILNLSNLNTGSGNGYGGLYSTVHDMKTFIEALLVKKSLMSQASLDIMTTITTASFSEDELYGVTIRKDFLNGAPDAYGLGHRGRDLGYTADLFYFPNQDITMAYLINYGTDAKSSLREVFYDFREAIYEAMIEE